MIKLSVFCHTQQLCSKFQLLWQCYKAAAARREELGYTVYMCVYIYIYMLLCNQKRLTPVAASLTRKMHQVKTQ